jgi:hypothetical protein
MEVDENVEGGCLLKSKSHVGPTFRPDVRAEARAHMEKGPRHSTCGDALQGIHVPKGHPCICQFGQAWAEARTHMKWAIMQLVRKKKAQLAADCYLILPAAQ